MPILIPFLIRYVLPLVAFLGLASYAVYTVWDMGRQDERAAWVLEKTKWEKDMAELSATSRAREDRLRSEFTEKLIRTRREQDKRNENINRRAADIHTDGLFVSSKNCSTSKDTGGGTPGNTGGDGSASDRIRLDKQDEENISAYARDAEKLKEQYEGLRALVIESKCFKIIN